MAAPIKSTAATAAVLKELQLWRFYSQLEAVFIQFGDGPKYNSTDKNQMEASNVLDRWLQSFQVDYSQSMDPDFPIYPLALEETDSVNEKLITECVQKRFSASRDNAVKIFNILRDKINSFKLEEKERRSRQQPYVLIKYDENQEDSVAQIRVSQFMTPMCSRVMFLVRNFGLLDTARMLLRYESIGCGAKQWGDTVAVHNVLYRAFGVRYEGFASPLSSKMLGREGTEFYSLFPDTDEQFGSLGDFFSADFAEKSGGWILNPPFVEALLERVAQKVLDYVQNDDDSDKNWFILTYPHWTDTNGWRMLDGCGRFKLASFKLTRGNYTEQNCYGDKIFKKNFKDRTVFLIGKELPAGMDADKLQLAFGNNDEDSIRRMWLDHCRIVIASDREE